MHVVALTSWAWRVAVLGASTLLLDLSATATDFFGADREVTSTVKLDAAGNLTGHMKLQNGSTDALCVVAVIAFVNSSNVVVGGRKTVVKCVNGVQTQGTAVSRTVAIAMTIDDANLRAAASLRVKTTTDTASGLDVLLPRLFP